jgi:hypothetical protein
MPEGIGYQGYDDINRFFGDQEAQLRADAADQAVIERNKKHIEDWFEKISNAIKHDRYYRERWANDRTVARGEYNSPVSTNLISAILAVLAAFLYAKNPDVSVTPSDSVDKNRLVEYRQFAKTIEIVVSRMFHDAHLKRQAKRWIRGTQTVGIGWLKAMIQTRKEKEPIMDTRINDLTDQLDKIRTKAIRLKLGEDEEEILISEIESNILAAESRLEISVAEGLVIDYMNPADVIIATECGEVENYLAAPWICFATYKNEDEILAITGWDKQESFEWLKSADRYFKRPRKEGDKGEGSGSYIKASDEDTESTDGFYMVYEVWSKEDGVVYTLIEGITERWARPRYAPITGKRFYPVFSLGFHYVDGERYPQSDVFQLKKLAQEYNETRSDLRVHRQRARPGTVFNEEVLDPDSVTKLAGSELAEYIGIKTVLGQNADLNQIFASKKYPPIDIGLYDTTPILRDMEKVSGAQEALQSSIQVEKTATEAEIQEAGRGARTGARKDDLEDQLTELAEYVVQIALQQMDLADAERYAGPGAVWMPLSVDQALQLFDLSIKAGSTSKPKRKTDREAWGTLLPLILDLVERIGNARTAGKEWAAKPIIAALKETLERADDTASIDMFLPVPPEEEVAAAGQPDPETLAKTKLDTAGSIDKTASAVEKLPSLVFSPQVRELLGMGQEQEPTVEALASGLQQQLPPAPDPI